MCLLRRQGKLVVEFYLPCILGWSPVRPPHHQFGCRRTVVAGSRPCSIPLLLRGSWHLHHRCRLWSPAHAPDICSAAAGGRFAFRTGAVCKGVGFDGQRMRQHAGHQQPSCGLRTWPGDLKPPPPTPPRRCACARMPSPSPSTQATSGSRSWQVPAWRALCAPYLARQGGAGPMEVGLNMRTV